MPIEQPILRPNLPSQLPILLARCCFDSFVGLFVCWFICRLFGLASHGIAVFVILLTSFPPVNLFSSVSFKFSTISLMIFIHVRLGERISRLWSDFDISRQAGAITAAVATAAVSLVNAIEPTERRVCSGQNISGSKMIEISGKIEREITSLRSLPSSLRWIHYDR